MLSILHKCYSTAALGAFMLALAMAGSTTSCRAPNGKALGSAQSQNQVLSYLSAHRRKCVVLWGDGKSPDLTYVGVTLPADDVILREHLDNMHIKQVALFAEETGRT